MSIFIEFDLTEYYRPQTLEINDEVNARSTARFQLVDKTGLLDVQDGQPIYIYDHDGNLIFGGFSFFPKRNNPIGTDAIFYDIDCVDQQCIADRYLVAESYINQNAGYIVQDLIAKYLANDGVTAGTIQPGNTLDVVKFPRVGTVTQALDQLAEIAGFIWYIDYDKKLYFMNQSTMAAGFNITDTSPINNVNLRQDRSKYRNRQYIRGGTTTTDVPISSEAPSPKPDGVARTFVLRYPVSAKPTIYINSVQVSPDQIGVNGVDGQIIPLQWYYQIGSNTITQDLNQTVLATSDTITVDYVGLIPLLVVVEDADAITARADIENLSGVYENLETMPTVNDKQQALDIANGRLNKYTKVEREITYQTYTNGLAAGQVQTITLTKYNVSAGEFLIDRMTIRDLDGFNKFAYDVHAVDGQPFGGWTNFFKSLIRKEPAKIDYDEKLIVLTSKAEKEYWSEVITETVFSCPIVNDTLYPADLMYPC